MRPIRVAHMLAALACWLTVGCSEANAVNDGAVASRVELTPKFTDGTTVASVIHRFNRVKLPPKLNVCLSFTQVKLSWNCLTGALRSSGARVAVAVLTPKPGLLMFRL